MPAMKLVLTFSLCLLLFAGLTRSASAHDVGLSTATTQLHSNRLDALLTFAAREVVQIVPLDADHDGLVSVEEFAAGHDRLAAVFATNCQVRFDGTPAIPTAVRCGINGSDNVDVMLSFATPKFKELEITFAILHQLAPGHRMFFSLLSPANETIAERLLSQSSPSVTIQLDAAAPAAPAHEPPPSFFGFVKLGVEHIGTGYDHLLFLFALLIVTRSFRSALVVITAFTLAHSITLALATFNLVQLPARLTEPLIALSIVYVGVENLVRHGDPQHRWRLTFAFGLIHGFGFASVLHDMGVGDRPGGVAMPLFAFNLGVELGQITVAAVALPIIWQLRKKEFFVRYGVPALSVIVALAGAFWFVQRVWF